MPVAARQSPRKSTNHATPAITKQARRCRVCEGRPLKSMCACTINADGTRRVQQRPKQNPAPLQPDTTAFHTPNPLPGATPTPPVETVGAGNISTTLLPLPTPEPPQTWTADRLATAVTHPAQENMTDRSRDSNQISTIVDSFNTGSAASIEGGPAQTSALHATQQTAVVQAFHPTGTGPSTTFGGKVSTVPEPHIAPTEMFTSMGPMISMPDFGEHPSDAATLHRRDATSAPFWASDHEDDGHSGDSSSDSNSESRTPHHKKRPHTPGAGMKSLQFRSTPGYQKARKTWKSPRAPRQPGKNLYGKLNGSMQGSLPLTILRKKPLEPTMIDQNKSVQRYGREIRSLLLKAERLAVQTSSWIFIGAQHPDCRKAFIHYTSDRLRTDSLQDTENLVQEFAGVVNKLNTIRKSSAEASQLKLLETEKAFLKYKEDAQRELEAAQQRLQVMDKETVYLRDMLCQTQRYAQPSQTEASGSHLTGSQPVASKS